MRFASAGLARHFADGSTLVAPSRLLASFITHQYTISQLSQRRQSWERPAIQSVETWLVNLWREARYANSRTPTILSPLQERILWKQLFEKEHPELFDPSGAARLAVEATRRIAEWQISTEGEAWESDRDGEQFRKLLGRFRNRCREEKWITRSELWASTPQWIAQGLCRPGKTVFSGFDEPTPALANLLNVLGPEAALDSVRRSLSKRRVSVKACSGFEEEIEYASRWARNRFEEQPDRSVLIGVPSLADHQDIVERKLNHVFYPSRSLLFRNGERTSEIDDCAFHITVAKPLSSHSVVVHAQLLLGLIQPRIAIADASSILRSPFLRGSASERSARALADLELRRGKELDVTLSSIERVTRDCPLLASIWPNLNELMQANRQKRELSTWGKLFGDILGLTGWPGESDLDASGQQAVEAWAQAISELATLQLVTGPVALDDAISQLTTIMTGMGSPERGNWWSPVQVFDCRHAPGIEFDAAVVTGLSEDTWPPEERPWPFIPFQIQRANKIPQTVPSLLRRERERQTRSLLKIAPVLTVTCSGRLAPLIRSFARVTPHSDPIWDKKVPGSSIAYDLLTSIEDSNGPAFTPSETAYGGVGIIRAQSLCPFKSFAESRLRASRPEDACFGFDARDRGSFLHAALEDLWKSLVTLERLRSLSPDKLGSLVQEAVARAVVEDRSSPLHQLATQTERERLVQVINEWLAIEKDRKQPFTVEHIEEKRSFEIAGLHLRLRVDRIDRLHNGNVILIDYKSGEQKAANLAGPRPSEPQLLVYASAVEDRVDGLFFAQMKPRDLKAIGWSRELIFPPPSPRARSSMRKDWDDYLDQSRTAVRSLAADFMEGRAIVDPAPGACTYCNLKPLCRIQEREASAEDSGDDD